MPRCEDSWLRQGDVRVGVTATCASQKQFYTLVYSFVTNDPALPVRPGGKFDSTRLKKGVQWTVPAGYRCPFQIVTTGGAPIQTALTINGSPAECHGVHCQGACTPTGPAGIAGSWAITGRKS